MAEEEKGSFNELLSEELKDPEFARAYEDSQPEFEVRRVLVEARSEKGITQKELAESLGIRPRLLEEIESGKTSPTLEMVVSLARKLGRTVSLRFE
jgi:DNA-binding XRE family transcriptional regulator